MQITRDRWGIPHVEAEGLDGLFRGQGYACAQDRLWQMEWERRRALGRASELVGARGLTVDRQARRYRLPDRAAAGYASLGAEAQAMVDAYAQGVNEACGDGARAIELEMLGATFEPWEPWHCVAAFLGRHVLFGAPWRLKFVRTRGVLPALGLEAALAFRAEGVPGDEVPSITAGMVRIPAPDVDAGPALEANAALDGRVPAEKAPDVDEGSNGWVLSGDRTATGRPLVAGDPHRTFEAPNVYLQVYLRCPGVDVAGLAFAGVPGVPHFGHAGRVVWNITSASADGSDAFVERFDAQGRCLGPDGWYEPDRRVDTVGVRDGEPVEVESVVTRHGPIVEGRTRDGAGVALCTPSLRSPGGSFGSFVPLLRARDVDDVLAAVATWAYPANNWMCADASGRIAYTTAGELPVRPEVNRWFLVPGWSADNDWTGLRDDRPTLRDPAEGVIVTANNRIGDDPSVSPTFAAPWRALRIHDRLRDVTDAGVEEMASIHRDVVSMPARAFAERVRALEVEGDAARAKEVITSWDCNMHGDSQGAAVYAAVRAAVARLRRADVGKLLDAPSAPGEPAVPAGMLQTLPPSDDVIAEALGQGWRDLEKTLGSDAAGWRWASLHRTRHAHALAAIAPDVAAAASPAGVAVAGDGGCVMAAGATETHVANGGSVARYVFETDERPRGGWIVPLGASGDPSSPHFADQQALWADGRLLPIEP